MSGINGMGNSYKMDLLNILDARGGNKPKRIGLEEFYSNSKFSDSASGTDTSRLDSNSRKASASPTELVTVHTANSRTYTVETLKFAG